MTFPVCTLDGGMAQANVPDVCNTPSPAGPVPMAYPNMAELSSADDTIDKVLVAAKPTIVQASSVARSQGDEAGSPGGVVSGSFGEKVSFRQASSKVYAAGKKVVLATCMTAHNVSSPNAPLGQVTVPSQTKVFTQG